MSLVCGFAFRPDADPELALSVEAAMAAHAAGAVVWMHFNKADTRARRWLESAGVVPAAFVRLVAEREPIERFESAPGGGLIAVFEDFVFEGGPSATDVSPLWVWVSGRVFVTVRSHALFSTDRLRHEARASLRAADGMDLFVRLAGLQVGTVESMRRAMETQVDRAEDDVLVHRLGAHREALAHVRRSCAHLRRHFGPQRGSLHRFLAHPATKLSPAHHAALAEVDTDLAHEMEEAAALYERAKLLQEEHAAHLAEETNRILFILTMISAVFMPMTLITGIWGMNVAGLPGTKDEAAFWWVTALIVVTGLATFGVLFGLRRR